MKKNIFFLVGLIFIASATVAQLKSKSSFKENEHSLQPSGPFWWTCDSTYYSKWVESTTTWDLFQKEYQTLDNRGNVILRLYNVLIDSTSQWRNNTRYRNEFYDNNDPKKKYTEKWNYTDNNWVDVLHLFYDENGQYTEWQYLNYNQQTNKITHGYRTLHTYSPGSASEIDDEFDASAMTWVHLLKITETYNPNNQITEDITMFWDETNSQWKNSNKKTYSYSSGGLLQTDQSFTWNDISLTWNPTSKSEYNYNSSNLKESKYFYYWNSGTSGWDQDSRIIFGYDPEGDPVLETREEWNFNTYSWELSESVNWEYFPDKKLKSYCESVWNPVQSTYIVREYLEYDSAGNEINYRYMFIDPSYTFHDGYQYFYTYIDNKPIESVYQVFNESTQTLENLEKRIWAYDNNNCTTETDQGYNNGVWTNTFLQQHYYSDFIGINEHPSPQDYCVFSNPINSGKTIMCDALKGKSCNLKLINMNGQVIYSTNVFSGTVTFPSVAAGEYILQLIPAGEKPVSGKVLVK